MGLLQFFRNLFGSGNPSESLENTQPVTTNKKKKVVCAWIGSFPDKDEFYGKYLSVDYGDEDFDDEDFDDDAEMVSPFGKDSGLGEYDDAFIESWWFENLTVEKVLADRENLLDEEYFFDDLIEVLKNRNLSGKNTITFMFGEKGHYPANEELFDYSGNPSGKPIEFIFKKVYAAD